MTLYRLPYDSHRCEPLQPDSHCRQCLRWAGLPGQTAGPRTPCQCRASGWSVPFLTLATSSCPSFMRSGRPGVAPSTAHTSNSGAGCGLSRARAGAMFSVKRASPAGGAGWAGDVATFAG